MFCVVFLLQEIATKKAPHEDVKFVKIYETFSGSTHLLGHKEAGTFLMTSALCSSVEETNTHGWQRGSYLKVVGSTNKEGAIDNHDNVKINPNPSYDSVPGGVKLEDNPSYNKIKYT